MLLYFNVYTKHLGYFLKCRFRLTWSGEGTKFCISTNSQVKLMLLVPGPYIVKQSSREYNFYHLQNPQVPYEAFNMINIRKSLYSNLVNL